jgi:hypothetical protein
MQTRIENSYRIYTGLKYKFNCIVCGDEFKCRSINAKYCSQRCKNDRSIENRKIQAINKRNSSNTCKICSIIFVKGELHDELDKLNKIKGVEIYKEKSVFKGNQYSAPLSIIDNEPKHNTQKIVAEKLGWSLIQNDKNKVKLYCSSKCKQKAYRNKVTQKIKVI